MRIGLLSFSDGRTRVHETLRPGIQRHERRIAAALEQCGAEPVRGESVIHQPRMAVREAKRLLAHDVAAVAFNIPVFAFPNLAVIAADVLRKPVVILSPGEAGLPGMGGMLAAGGALEQTGHFQTRIWGPLSARGVKRALAVFVKACGARHALRGQVYGQIGGRSIGMLTGVASSGIEWHRVFGVDADHVDQSEILRRAALVPEKERARIARWLEQHCGAVCYAAGSKLTRETLKEQAACAQAVKQIIDDRQLDFVGIKCHYDLSEYYWTQCLSAAFLPATIDWDGPRAPVACACEADGDGALTMQILQLISGIPALFMDVRHYDARRRLWTLCNCGAASVHYAARGRKGAKPLDAVELVPVIPKYAGAGCHVKYIGGPGPLTCARLMHDRDGMVLLAYRAEAVAARESWLAESCPSWPHLFVRSAVDPRTLLNELHANHIHAVAGDVIDELALFARVAGVRLLAL
ncbi:L-fucose isomerase [bacterium]|nr:L-fucose isomerase [bacterium]